VFDLIEVFKRLGIGNSRSVLERIDHKISTGFQIYLPEGEVYERTNQKHGEVMGLRQSMTSGWRFAMNNDI
jgi:hypothetical protein